MNQKKDIRRQRAVERMMEQMAKLNQQAETMFRADDNLFNMWMNKKAPEHFKHLQNERKAVLNQIQAANKNHGTQVSDDTIATYGTDFKHPSWMSLIYGKFDQEIYDTSTRLRPRILHATVVQHHCESMLRTVDTV